MQIPYATEWNYQNRSDTKSQMSGNWWNGLLSGPTWLQGADLQNYRPI